MDVDNFLSCKTHLLVACNLCLEIHDMSLETEVLIALIFASGYLISAPTNVHT